MESVRTWLWQPASVCLFFLGPNRRVSYQNCRATYGHVPDDHVSDACFVVMVPACLYKLWYRAQQIDLEKGAGHYDSLYTCGVAYVT